MRRGLMMGALVLLAACGEDDPVKPGTNNNSLTANIDGVAFQPTSVIASRTPIRVFISATAGNNSMTLSVVAPAGPGTVVVGGQDPLGLSNLLYTQGTAAGSPAWAAGGSGGSGTVTFTTLTATEASGIFAFDAAPLLSTPAVNTKSVTAGSFSVKF